MENIKNNHKNDLNNMNDEAHSLEQKNIYYNCPECQSVIEILKLDEEFIEFNCNNNHNNKMKIKEYLDKIKEYVINIKKNIYHIVLNVISIYVKNV